MTRKFGYKKDVNDNRDFKYKSIKPLKYSFILPCAADIRKELGQPDIFDQGELGSCTANSASSAIWYVRSKQFKNGGQLSSRLFVYYNTRKEESNVLEDEGATLRETIKACAKYGVLPERDWPYVPERHSFEPKKECYEIATDNQVVKYYRLRNTLRDMKACIADGYPFVFGFQIFQSFMDEHTSYTGRMKMPIEDEQCLGGHAVLAIGYNDKYRYFIIQNSWGKGWGDRGYFYMPYEYITNSALADDFWTIRLMEA